MTQEIIDLIQGAVDGVNTSQQQQALQDACESNASIQSELDSALEVGRILDSGIREIQPSPTFKARVMDSLPEQPAWSKTRAPIRRRSSASIFKLPARPIFSLAYGLVAGALVAVAVMTSISPQLGGISNRSGAAGTMVDTDLELFSDRITLSTGEDISIEAVEADKLIRVEVAGDVDETFDITVILAKSGDILYEQTLSPRQN